MSKVTGPPYIMALLANVFSINSNDYITNLDLANVANCIFYNNNDNDLDGSTIIF